MIPLKEYDEDKNLFMVTKQGIVKKTSLMEFANVRKNGDKALFEYCEKFDKAKLTALQVTAEEIEEAFALVDPELIAIMEKAAVNIRAFHSRQARSGFEIQGEDGIVLGQRITPVDRAGLYVPGGTAAYPSTVLMDSIPAKLAGCREVVITTPPGKDGPLCTKS